MSYLLATCQTSHSLFSELDKVIEDLHVRASQPSNATGRSRSSLQKEACCFKRTVPSFHIGGLHYRGERKNEQGTVTNTSICTKLDKRSCYVTLQNGYAFAILKSSKTTVSDMYIPVWL